MVKHNNPVVTSHFKKHWVERVRCNFNKPMKARKRKQRRLEKASKLFPRPLQTLRPLVRIASAKHNNRLRFGRGFSISELKGAKLNPLFARTIGISIDKRRRNISEEGYNRNVQRLLEYKSKLILYPKRHGSDKRLRKGVHLGGLDDTPKAQRTKVSQVIVDLLPSKKPELVTELREITDKERKKSSWRTLRNAYKDKRAFAFRMKKKIKSSS